MPITIILINVEGIKEMLFIRKLFKLAKIMENLSPCFSLLALGKYLIVEPLGSLVYSLSKFYFNILGNNYYLRSHWLRNYYVIENSSNPENSNQTEILIYYLGACLISTISYMIRGGGSIKILFGTFGAVLFLAQDGLGNVTLRNFDVGLEQIMLALCCWEISELLERQKLVGSILH